MLVGRKWDRNSNALRLGTVSDQTGLTTKIFLTAKGEFRNEVQPRVVDIVPDGLTVKIDPPSQIGGGMLFGSGLKFRFHQELLQRTIYVVKPLSQGISSWKPGTLILLL